MDGEEEEEEEEVAAEAKEGEADEGAEEYYGARHFSIYPPLNGDCRTMVGDLEKAGLRAAAAACFPLFRKPPLFTAATRSLSRVATCCNPAVIAMLSARSTW